MYQFTFLFPLQKSNSKHPDAISMNAVLQDLHSLLATFRDYPSRLTKGTHHLSKTPPSIIHPTVLAIRATEKKRPDPAISSTISEACTALLSKLEALAA